MQNLPRLIPHRKCIGLLTEGHQVVIELKNQVLMFDIISIHSEENMIKTLILTQVPNILRKMSLPTTEDIFEYIVNHKHLILVQSLNLILTFKREYGYDYCVFRTEKRKVSEQVYLERKLSFLESWTASKQAFYLKEIDKIDYRLSKVISALRRLSTKYQRKLRGTRLTIKRIAKHSKKILRYAAYLEKFNQINNPSDHSPQPIHEFHDRR